MSNNLKKIYIDLTPEQIAQLRPLMEEVKTDADNPGRTSNKTILAQVMTTWADEAFLIVSVIPSDMTEAIRNITKPD